MVMFSHLPEPAVSRKGLMISAGLFWVIGGLILVVRSGMVLRTGRIDVVWPAALGVILGSLKYRLVFTRIVTVNIRRINELSPHKDKICLFAFQSLQSYLFVIVMIGLGIGIRYIGLTGAVLATIYLAIGTALLLSSVLYFRGANAGRRP